jgi:tetraacyldisaccharide 4'-kinase
MKSLILSPLGSLYGAFTRARTQMYERGTFKTTRLERPVISIGNMTTGGTGKTPLVEWVARTLADEGKKVCILTRGYGRKNPDRRVIVSDATQVFSNPTEAGDEPFLLATKLLGIAAVISDADRIAAGQGAIKHLRTDCFVLDDGFQHLRIARDLNIVSVDATNPWGGGRLLPLGRLREPLAGLKRADCIVLTRCDQAKDVETIRDEINQLSGDRPVFQSQMKTRGLVPLKETDDLTATPFAAFCGIGNPQSFFNHLKLSGYEIVIQQSFADHHIYTQSDINNLRNIARAAGAKSFVTTAKDAVKLRDLGFELPCYSLEIEIQIESADELRRLVLNAAHS